MLIKMPADLDWIFQGLFDRNIKPEFNAGRDKANGEEKKNAGGQEWKCNKSSYKTGAELSTHDFTFSILKEFDQISENKKYE